MTENVSVDRQGKVAVVTYDRGRARNALSQQAMLDLTAVAEDLKNDLDLQAVVLTGPRDHFCAGFDLTDDSWRLPDEATALERRAVQSRGAAMCRAWASLPQVTIAAIEGYAVGGGVAIAAACDWRVVGKSAFLTLPEVRLGLNMGWGSIPRLVHLLGPARAKRFMILCERIDAATAREWGLVDEIAPDGGALEKARELAEAAAAMPALAVRMTKETVDAMTHHADPPLVHMDIDQNELTFGGPDFAAAEAAFKKK